MVNNGVWIAGCNLQECPMVRVGNYGRLNRTGYGSDQPYHTKTKTAIEENSSIAGYSYFTYTTSLFRISLDELTIL
jgi:hypothetical protein